MEKTEVFFIKHWSYSLNILLIFMVKYQRKVFTSAILNKLLEIFSFVCSRFEAKLVKFDGEEASVQLWVIYPPKIAISELVHFFKALKVC